jgi:hypothetical protein
VPPARESSRGGDDSDSGGESHRPPRSERAGRNNLRQRSMLQGGRKSAGRAQGSRGGSRVAAENAAFRVEEFSRCNLLMAGEVPEEGTHCRLGDVEMDLGPEEVAGFDRLRDAMLKMLFPGASYSDPTAAAFCETLEKWRDYLLGVSTPQTGFMAIFAFFADFHLRKTLVRPMGTTVNASDYRTPMEMANSAVYGAYVNDLSDDLLTKLKLLPMTDTQVADSPVNSRVGDLMDTVTKVFNKQAPKLELVKKQTVDGMAAQLRYEILLQQLSGKKPSAAGAVAMMEGTADETPRKRALDFGAGAPEQPTPHKKERAPASWYQKDGRTAKPAKSAQDNKTINGWSYAQLESHLEGKHDPPYKISRDVLSEDRIQRYKKELTHK